MNLCVEGSCYVAENTSEENQAAAVQTMLAMALALSTGGLGVISEGEGEGEGERVVVEFMVSSPPLLPSSSHFPAEEDTLVDTHQIWRETVASTKARLRKKDPLVIVVN